MEAHMEPFIEQQAKRDWPVGSTDHQVTLRGAIESLWLMVPSL